MLHQLKMDTFMNSDNQGCEKVYLCSSPGATLELYLITSLGPRFVSFPFEEPPQGSGEDAGDVPEDADLSRFHSLVGRDHAVLPVGGVVEDKCLAGAVPAEHVELPCIVHPSRHGLLHQQMLPCTSALSCSHLRSISNMIVQPKY